MKRTLAALFLLLVSVPVSAALKSDSGALSGAITGNLNVTGNAVITGTVQASTWTVGGSTALAQINVQNDRGNVLGMGIGGSTHANVAYADTPFFVVNFSTALNIFFSSSTLVTTASTSPSVAFSSAGFRAFMQYPSSSPAIFVFDQTQGYVQLFSTTSMSQYVKIGVTGGNNAIEWSSSGPDPLLWPRTGSLNLLSTNATKTVNLKAGTTGAFTIDAASGVVVGTAPVTGPRGSISLVAGVYMSTQAAAPTAVSGTGIIYATATSGTADIVVMDSAGNKTQISAHDPKTGAWIFNDSNDATGRSTYVDMDSFVAAVEEITGRKFNYRTRAEYWRAVGAK